VDSLDASAVLLGQLAVVLCSQSKITNESSTHRSADWGTGGLADSNGISVQIVRACTDLYEDGTYLSRASPGVAACAFNRADTERL
jgi:hypothetical protein